jgi:hypothetical protein
LVRTRALRHAGGKAAAVARPVEALVKVARFRLALFRQAPTIGVTVGRAEVNGDPGLVARDSEGRLVSVMSLEIGDGRIRRVRSVMNPDKLAHLGEVGDLRSLVRRRSG